MARGSLDRLQMPGVRAAAAALKDAVGARLSTPSRLFGALNGSVQEISTGRPAAAKLLSSTASART